jgi:hypothetical protein
MKSKLKSKHDNTWRQIDGNTDTSPRPRMHQNHIENPLENTGVLHSSPLKQNFALEIRPKWKEMENPW